MIYRNTYLSINNTANIYIRGEDIKLDPQTIDLCKNSKISAVVDSVEVMGNENNLYFS